MNTITSKLTVSFNLARIIQTVFRQKIFDEDTILSELNPLLYEEVVTCGIINYIKECDFFRTCREDLQAWIINSCKGLQVATCKQPDWLRLAGINFKSNLSVNYAIFSELKCINLIQTLLWPGE